MANVNVSDSILIPAKCVDEPINSISGKAEDDIYSPIEEALD
jgi:hypothetical protein